MIICIYSIPESSSTVLNCAKTDRYETLTFKRNCMIFRTKNTKAWPASDSSRSLLGEFCRRNSLKAAPWRPPDDAMRR